MEKSLAFTREFCLTLRIGLKLELEKVVSLDFDKDNNDKYEHTYYLPVLSGPHQERPWVRSLKRLVSID